MLKPNNYNNMDKISINLLSEGIILPKLKAGIYKRLIKLASQINLGRPNTSSRMWTNSYMKWIKMSKLIWYKENDHKSNIAYLCRMGNMKVKKRNRNTKKLTLIVQAKRVMHN